MQHDLMYSGGAGGDRLLMFGSSSSIASIAAAAAAAAAAGEMGAASRPRLKCPRCDSLNTKFCYYNNYNLSQPRHFCKACRRYWTKGGILRNVPIGGASRRSASSAGSSSSASKRSSGASPSPSSSKVLRRHMMYQQDVEPAGGMAYNPAAAWVESPTSSSPDASTFSMNSLDAAPGFFPAPPGLSEESSSGGADLISTSAGVPVSPPHTFSATTVVVDGPSVDDLMMAAELFPFDLGVGGSDPFQITPQAEDVELDVDDLAGTMEFVDQTVPLGVGDRSLEAVVNGCYVEREEVADREADLSLRAPVAPDAGDTAAVTFNYVDNWQDLPHVPLVSDTNIYYDYDLLAFGVSIAGCDGAADVDGQQQQQKQQQELGDDQPQQQLNLWDNSSYYCQHWGGIDIDQSLLDLL